MIDLFTAKKNNILILAPHTDDGEFGCGGTIVKFIESGAKVVYIAFSAAEASVPQGFESDILRKEVINATKSLGIANEDCICLNFEVRKFPAYRQEILEEMIRLNKQYNPNIVLLPSRYDTHQDHSTIFQEGFRAFKKTTMLGYEVPWNNLEFHNNCFVRLDSTHIDKKIDALACYKSQSGRDYATPNFIRSLAVTRGVQIGVDFAECFEIVRLVA
jgi:LmbE family N-acetylglucosaminyl deacetylase